MNFYSGRFDGIAVDRISQCKALVVPGDDRFAVLTGHYSGGTNPYLALEAGCALDGACRRGAVEVDLAF